MNASLAISLLVFGGWVLPEGSGTIPLDDNQGLLNSAPGPSGGAGMQSSGGYNGPSFDQPLRQPTMRRPGATGQRSPLMPGSPTDSGMGSMMPLPPTSASPVGTAGAAGGMYGAGGARSGLGLGAGAGGVRTPSQPFASSNALATRAQTARQPASYFGGAAANEKAFESYRHQPAVSPWSNLFRTGSNGADNYATLVRPELEQRTLNQHFSGQIGNLRSNVWRQGGNLNQLNQDVQIERGLVNPNYFINYYQYYPQAGGGPGP
jgi:hypothetical protein